MKPLVIYHGNCQDGFTAAWAIWLKHPEWEYYPAKHGDSPPDVTDREVYMVDFSYKKPVLIEMAKQAKAITILDHHKTAKEALENITVDEEIQNSGCIVKVIFDMEKSGARLAWEFFHPFERTASYLIDHVEDRDLWRFVWKETQSICAYLFSQPYDFQKWSDIAFELTIPYSRGKIIENGQAILDKQAKDTEELLQNKFRIKIDGFKVWTVNLPYTFSSDADHILDENEPFASTFYFDGKDYIFSLRSRDGGEDVSAIAKKFGGGGHFHAAGFKVGFFNFVYNHAENIYEVYPNE